ncbi:hypothetical protein GYMLUDRAFT_219372, partial [Collybiopsis luxurians FD-317 M1]
MRRSSKASSHDPSFSWYHSNSCLASLHKTYRHPQALVYHVCNACVPCSINFWTDAHWSISQYGVIRYFAQPNAPLLPSFLEIRLIVDSIVVLLQVTYLFLVETANTALDMVMMYQPLIAEYGTQEAVAKFPTLFMTEPIVIVLISTPIQCFFAWRILKITRSYFIPVIIVALAFASSAGGFITGIKIAMLKLFTKKPELHWSALLWFLTSCVADLLITATLVMSLSKRKTGFDGTDSVIDKLTRTTVQTGMITAVCAIGDVVFFMALPRTALNFIWDLALSKLYTNCLMSTLNARTGLSSRGLGSTEPVQDRGQVVDSDLKFASDNLRSIAQIISEPKVQESDIGVIS